MSEVSPGTLEFSADEKRRVLQELLRKRAGRPQTFPLSFGQRRLWFLDRLTPGNPAYNMPAAVRLGGDLDMPALGEALRQVVRRHGVLRTTFHLTEGEPVQRVEPPGHVGLPLVDLGALPAEIRSAEAQRLLGAEALRPFDLAVGPPLRVMLLRAREGEHLVALTMHHIVSDEWSRTLLVREISAFYAALSTGDEPAVPQLPIQYADFAVWQRRWLDEGTCDGQLSYWRERLRAVPVLQLPTDRPRAPLPSGRGGARAITIPQPLADRLSGLGRERRATPFMTLLAAFQALLARYTGQEDIALGTPVAGRTRLETEHLIGFFVNTLVLRADLSQDPSFRELLDRGREVALGAFAHQDLPFEKIVDELQPERSLSHAPLFQVLFAFQSVPREPGGERPLLAGLRVDPAPVRRGTAKFDLSLAVNGGDGSLEAVCEYSLDLLDATTVERFLGHWLRLLEGAAAAPDVPMSRLPLLSAAESQALVEWNGTAETWGGREGSLLHELIGLQARRSPGAPAVVFAGESLSHGELDRRANRLAHRLRRLGVGPDVRVGLLLERSPEMVVSLLAVLKAGGAYVPLDPEYPASRLAFMLEDSRVPILLLQERLRERLPETGRELLCLDPADAEAFAAEPDEAPAVAVDPDNLAYVIYTSGSTGRPKGAMNSHRGIVNRLLWMQRWCSLDSPDRVLQKTPFSFDVSVWELFLPLLVGARLVVARPGGHQDGAYLRELIAEQAVTVVHFVPSMLQVFLDEEGLETLQDLRLVICSGEALPPGVVARFFRRLPAELHNLYGPTEAAVDVTFHRCRRADARGVVPIGRPITNLSIHLLDRGLEPVPVGVPGELHIGGVGVGRGYWNRPDLTAGAFVPDPLGREPGGRLYRTGDLARYLPDGEIDYLGRVDHQVKVRGFRIELGEIERSLVDHPAVREAVVVARGEGSLERRLVAYLVIQGESGPTVTELRSFLGNRLPPYMVPAGFVFLESLPLSPNGKVDRRALPAPGGDRPELAESYVPPRTAIEEALAAIWGEVLRLDRVGVHDNFFALGGDSILAVQVAARANRAGLPLTTAQIFQGQTVAELALLVESEPPSGPVSAAPAAGRFALSGLDSGAIARVTGGDPAVEDLYPATPIQRAMLAYCLASPDSEVGFEQMACELHGDLDLPAFARAWERVFARHAVLRTGFRWEEAGEPLQVVRSDVGVPLAQEDWRDRPAERRHQDLADYLAAERRRGFDLGRPPLMRLSLLRIAERGWLVVWSHHHLLMDGWCRSLVLNEALSHYEAFREGVDLQPEAPRPYRDYVAWLSRQDLAQAEAFWRRALAGFRTPVRLRLGPPPRAAAGEELYARHGIHLTEERTEALKTLARGHRLTLNTFVKAAWALLLERYALAEDVVFGTIFSGRPAELPGIEGMVGLFMNVLPVRVPVRAAEPLLPWLGELQREHAEYHGYEHTPLDRVHAWSEVPGALHLFDTLLVFENFPVDRAVWRKAGSLELRGVRAQAKTNYALTLMAAPGRELSASLIHDTRRLDPVLVERMGRHLQTLLTEMVRDPQRAVADLPMLAEEERRQALAAGGPGTRLLDRRLRLPPAGVPADAYPREGSTATGRVARWLPGGALEPLGWVDRGFEIAGFGSLGLWELEAALRRAPGVRDAAVVMPASGGAGEELTLAVVASPGAGPDLSALHRLVRQIVPASLVPVSWRFLEAIPYDAEGRVDDRSLAALVAERRAEGSGGVAPRNVLEFKLTAIWEEVLGRRPISVTESFFDLGGNSILAMRVAARIREEFQRKLPLSVFFEESTIEGLASLLRRETDYLGSPLVAVQPRGRGTPFFCVHPIGGSIMRYGPLSRLLGDERPFYGLEARNHDVPYGALEEIAAEYLGAVAAAGIFPDLLGGWSFGGIVAFEMARQLERQGRRPRLLVVFDTVAPVPERHAPDGTEDLDADDPRQLVALLEVSTGRRLPISFETLAELPPDEQKELILSEAKRHRIVPAELQLAEALRDLKGFETRGRLSRSYNPQGSYHGPVVLFHCRELQPGMAPEMAAIIERDPLMGWGRVTTGPVRVVPVPGSHQNLFDKPHLEVVAQCLRDILANLPAEQKGDRHP